MIRTLALLILLAAAPGAHKAPAPPAYKPAAPPAPSARESNFVHSLAAADSLIRPGEKHFAHLWEVALNGTCACPRWSPDGAAMVMENTSENGCAQIFLLHATSPGHPSMRLISAGQGLATSPTFLGVDAVLYSLVNANPDSCRSSTNRWHDATWSLYPGSWLALRTMYPDKDLALDKVSDAIECASSPDGKRILFTSTPAIDPEIYVMKADGSGVTRLTTDPGYDGGACFSPDGLSICYQANHPREESDRAEFNDLLAKHRVSSALLDIWVMQADGSGRGQVTDLGATSMSPSFTPDSKRIIFASDYQDVQGRQFDLYITKLDGGTPEKITDDPSPEGFPLFSPSGHYLAFTSGRGAAGSGAQNLFIAEWK